MPTDKTLKISSQAHGDLAEYKHEHGHTSFDSAIRELLNEADDE